MAEIVKHVSDLSRREADDASQLGRLVVLAHPEIGEPAPLEAFPDELEGLQAAQRVVQLQWTAPGERKPQELAVLQEQFDALAKGGDMGSILRQAIEAKREREARAQAPARPRRGAAGGRSKVDYSSPEHAGMPHRGRITEEEKAYVRDHLDEVNARRRAAGKPEIDASDPRMRERYGL